LKKLFTKFKILSDEKLHYRFPNSLKNYSDKNTKTNKKPNSETL